jgi:very-short-patch-repair endonuclease
MSGRELDWVETAAGWQRLPDTRVQSRWVRERAVELRHTPTAAERVLWKRLCRSQLGVKFRRQRAVGWRIPDFWSHEARLVVEVDGAIHDTTWERDRARDAEFNAPAIRVIHFDNEAVCDETDECVAIIQQEVDYWRNSQLGSMVTFFGRSGWMLARLEQMRVA